MSQASRRPPGRTTARRARRSTGKAKFTLAELTSSLKALHEFTLANLEHNDAVAPTTIGIAAEALPAPAAVPMASPPLTKDQVTNLVVRVIWTIHEGRLAISPDFTFDDYGVDAPMRRNYREPIAFWMAAKNTPVKDSFTATKVAGCKTPQAIADLAWAQRVNP